MILRYTYDNMERLLTTSVERDGAEPVLLCCNTYNDLGRLATHSLGGTAEGSHAIIRTVPLMVMMVTKRGANACYEKRKTY